MSNEYFRVKKFQFDGTIRGFHLMMLRMFPHQKWPVVQWIDGWIKVGDVIYKKGNYYEA